MPQEASSIRQNPSATGPTDMPGLRNFATALRILLVANVLAALAAGFSTADMVRWLSLSVSIASLIAVSLYLSRQARSPALAEARLMALSARIRPHFLFNSLNGILGIIRNDPRRAE